MTNKPMAVKIASALREGFLHPGDPERNIKPTPILLPFKARHGMPKEMGDLMTETSELLGECIVALIEQDDEIVPRKEAKAMRRAVGKGPANPIATPVFCRCNPTEPLIYLTITDPESITLDGAALLRALEGRSVECPHDKVDE